jgi:hypothetical protein
MDTPLTREQLANRHFLEMRCRVLDLAAALDRLDRAEGASLAGDARFMKLRRGIETLLQDVPDRADRVQQIFSRTYDPAWRNGQR